ncbi:MAG: hypothetical protein ACE5DI_02455 [Candidatus Micrarchaeia archaeon]
MGLLVVVVLTAGCLEEEPASLSIINSAESKTVPVIDGRLEPGEWDDAERFSKELVMHDFWLLQKDAHPFVFYAKNDGRSLYLAFVLENEEHDGSLDDANEVVVDLFSIQFDNNDNGVLEENEDKKGVFLIGGMPFFSDEHRVLENNAVEDDVFQNGRGAMVHSNPSGKGDYVVEVEIPLNSGDSQDVSLKPGEKVRFNVVYFDKMNAKLKDTSFGALAGLDLEQSGNWGYLVLSNVSTQGDNFEPVDSLFEELTEFVPLETGKVGMTVVSWSGNYDDRLKSYEFAKALGVQIAPATVSWGEIEKNAGEYDWSSLEVERGLLRGVYERFEFTQFIMVINMHNRAVLPKDVENIAFNNERFVKRYLAFLDAYFARYALAGKKHYLIVGNEVDSYFLSHPEELPAFVEFYKAVHEHVRKRYPEIEVGVITTFDGGREGPVAELHEISDVVMFTFYDIQENWQFSQFREPEEILAEMVRFAKGKKVLIHEIGYSSSEKLGSSQEKQALYVSKLFAALHKHRQEVEAVIWWPQQDMSKELARFFTVTVWGNHELKSLFDENFEEYLQSTGLIHANGTPKLAFYEWKNQAREYYRKNDVSSVFSE